MRAQKEDQGNEVLDASFGSPTDPNFPSFALKMKEACEATNRGYTVWKTTRTVRQAFVDRQRRFYDVAVPLDPENTVPGQGIKRLLGDLFAALGGGTSQPKILAPEFAYPSHFWAPTFAGMNVVGYQAGHDQMRKIAHANESACAADPDNPPKLLLLNNPHNPSSHLISLLELAQIVRYAKKHELILIYDSAYIDIVEGAEHGPNIWEAKDAEGGWILDLFSMSKSYGFADGRIAFATGHPELTGALKGYQGYNEYGHFKPLLLLAEWMLSPECDHHVRNISAEYSTRRNIVCTGLRQGGFHMLPCQGTICCLGKVPPPYDYDGGSMQFAADLLQEESVLVAPGSGFGPAGEGLFRFAYVLNQSHCTEAVSRMNRFFASHSSVSLEQALT